MRYLHSFPYCLREGEGGRVKKNREGEGGNVKKK
jgi:hypothetical protein